MPALPLPWGRWTSGGSRPHGGPPRQTQGTPFSAALALLSTRRQDLRRVRLEKSAEVCHLPAGSRSALSSSRTPRLAPPCDGRTSEPAREADPIGRVTASSPGAGSCPDRDAPPTEVPAAPPRPGTAVPATRPPARKWETQKAKSHAGKGAVDLSSFLLGHRQGQRVLGGAQVWEGRGWTKRYRADFWATRRFTPSKGRVWGRSATLGPGPPQVWEGAG